MKYSPQELTLQLRKGLDKDNNVVDLPFVSDVIAILETYPITRDILLQTRIGKYVNELRKKTSCKSLAKRAKNLVRKWKDMPDTKPFVSANGVACDIKNGALPNFKATVYKQNGIITSTPQSGNGSQGSMSTPPSPAIGSSKHSPSLPLQSSHNDHLMLDGANCNANSIQSEDLLKTNIVNKKRRRTASPNRTCKKRITNTSLHVNGLSKRNNLYAVDELNDSKTLTGDLKFVAHDKKVPHKTDADRLKATMTPKVKTTAQLVELLSSKSGVKLENSETAAKIVMNKIEKEPDPINMPVVPPEAKPRSRKKNGGNTHLPPDLISQTKTELVHKFLATSINSTAHEMQNSMTPSPLTASCVSDDEIHSDCVQTESMASTSHFSNNRLLKAVDEPESLINDTKPVIPQNPWDLLPPINYNIEWEGDYTIPDPTEVNDEAIDRLHHSNIPGLNGQLDRNADFQNWRKTFTVSREDDNDGYIHILPYVDF